jgi:hypothetical protein
VQITRYPRTAPIIARPTPVLPDVGSTIVPPGRSRPAFSAASIIEIAIRSLTDPPGFADSSFATRFPGGWIRESLISGVPPTAASTSGWMSMRQRG